LKSKQFVFIEGKPEIAYITGVNKY